ncbi:MAG: hypothetical protein MMC23_008992 [Stictis urceolatum]|nr:hypothetical protein [Stictis urceolata]
MFHYARSCFVASVAFSSFVAPSSASGFKAKQLDYIFAFGDSYTDVGFNVTSPLHPSAPNFEGNPIAPGTSSAYANNYVQDMASEFNKSLIYLYDFAHSGAIVNCSLVDPYESVNNTFTAQVDNQFLPYLAPKPTYARWTSQNSLFIVFFGINDIDRAIQADRDWEAKVPLMMDTYWRYSEKLYSAGARNFAFLNLPPYWKSPGIISSGNDSLVSLAHCRTLLWNSNLMNRHQAFQEKHGSSVNSKLVDVMGLWEDMYAHPKQYGLANVTMDCDAYAGGTGTNLAYWDPSCSAPVNEYLWLNWLHPTWTVHRYLAKLVISTLGL